MNETITRTYSKTEQRQALRRLFENNGTLGIRPLARLVFQVANGQRAERTVDESFERDAAALRGVPWATVYNRLRKIGGDLR